MAELVADAGAGAGVPQISLLAAALQALPVLVANPAPGETVPLPAAMWPQVAAAIVIGRAGGVVMPRGARVVDVDLPLPTPVQARALWQRALAQVPAPLIDRLAAETRLASGAVMAIGALARTRAQVAGRDAPNRQDLRQAARSLGREALDALATRAADAGPSLSVPAGQLRQGAEAGSPAGDGTADAPGDAGAAAAVGEAHDKPELWAGLVVNDATLADLQSLEQRCRLRQSLADGVSAALAARLSTGVRALLRGPSGTGKSLAARLLAEVLGKDLYTCNLATVVSKYIGETEKRLAELLDAAEAMDVVLAIEEADSLFARRSETVKDSTDRYANMETNFLLQRMESFGGIVLLTTNLFGAIDTAFLRRFDAIIDFAAPGPADRLRLLDEHLPVRHAVSAGLRQEIAIHCPLTGGQLRNVVLDAALLARQQSVTLGDAELDRAVRREYRRNGGVCLLRRVA